MKKYDGYFTFYYDEKTGKIFLEIDQDRLEKEFLYFSGLSSGIGNGIERGQSSSAIATFKKLGPKILLIQPNYSYRAVTDNADEQKAVENAFAKSVVWGFTPVAFEGGKYLVDLTPFLIRDSQKIGDRIGARGFQGPGAAMTGRPGAASGPAATYRFDESRSVIDIQNTKNFPKNTEFEALITFTGGPSSGGRGGFGGPTIAPDPNAVTVTMHQSFIELPEPGYKPRKFDPRSGLNMFSYMDFSAPMTDPIVKRFTRRHRLEKKDPKAAVSEPVKPIVYYVDRGAPEPIKKALIEGGAWWNEAFESAGYKNAFIVKELPAGADPMDIRYNVVNWINRSGSPRAFSSGASYIDPRTGEIIKGVVTLGSDRHRQDYLIAEGLLQPYESGKPVAKKMEELAMARIRQLSAHEIGHTLGLFHNFAASPKDRASVMDYPFPRFTLKKDGTVDVSDSYAKGIGSWDKRAITWGYQSFPDGTNEDVALDNIIIETLKQGHIFIPDIGGYTHPTSHQWDDGGNAIEQLNHIMQVRRHVLDNFSEKAIPDGAPMATLEEVLVPMYLLHRYQIEAAAKTIGGLYFTHAVKNDGQVITKMLPPADQWKALDALLETIKPEALMLPEQLIQKIPPRPSGYASSIEVFTSHTGPTFDPLAVAESAASTTIASILDAQRAARLVEYAARDASQPGLLPVIDKLLEQTWKAPKQSGYTGALQTVVNNLTLKHLLALAANNEAAESVRGQAMLKVEELKEWMQSGLASAAPMQKANLLFGLAQIGEFGKTPDKFQPAPAVAMPPGAPIGMPAMDFLTDDILY
ncbi:DUF5117 domain-containing protein [Paracnuella aquatica]|nr:DUF5117 domain-containing protein [Paracnuella aquatica]